jgi:hypothetical protein
MYFILFLPHPKRLAGVGEDNLIYGFLPSISTVVFEHKASRAYAPLNITTIASFNRHLFAEVSRRLDCRERTVARGRAEAIKPIKVTITVSATLNLLAFPQLVEPRHYGGVGIIFDSNTDNACFAMKRSSIALFMTIISPIVFAAVRTAGSAKLFVIPRTLVLHLTLQLFSVA